MKSSCAIRTHSDVYEYVPTATLPVYALHDTNATVRLYYTSGAKYFLSLRLKSNFVCATSGIVERKTDCEDSPPAKSIRQSGFEALTRVKVC